MKVVKNFISSICLTKNLCCYINIHIAKNPIEMEYVIVSMYSYSMKYDYLF